MSSKTATRTDKLQAAHDKLTQAVESIVSRRVMASTGSPL